MSWIGLWSDHSTSQRSADSGMRLPIAIVSFFFSLFSFYMIFTHCQQFQINKHWDRQSIPFFARMWLKRIKCDVCVCSMCCRVKLDIWMKLNQSKIQKITNPLLNWFEENQIKCCLFTVVRAHFFLSTGSFQRNDIAQVCFFLSFLFGLTWNQHLPTYSLSKTHTNTTEHRDWYRITSKLFQL